MLNKIIDQEMADFSSLNSNLYNELKKEKMKNLENKLLQGNFI